MAYISKPVIRVFLN